MPFGKIILSLVLAFAPLHSLSDARACSRVLWNDNGRSVLVGRSMDWFENLRSNMWAMPRGIERDGLAGKNSLKWTSKYGCVAVTAYDLGTVDGMNEQGLAVHALYLAETDVGWRDAKLPGLSISLWPQYYLDNFATVAEVVEAHKKQPFQLLMASEPRTGTAGTVHLALNDAKGDSVILECIKGEIRVYHGRDYNVMTNHPTFDKQLENLKRYSGFGGDQALPGSLNPSDRFVCASQYVKDLPAPKSDREGADALLGVVRKVSVPFKNPGSETAKGYGTYWRVVGDLGNRVLYYDGVDDKQSFSIDLKKLDFAEGQPVRKLQVHGRAANGKKELSGDATDQFEKTELFQYLPPDGMGKKIIRMGLNFGMSGGFAWLGAIVGAGLAYGVYRKVKGRKVVSGPNL